MMYIYSIKPKIMKKILLSLITILFVNSLVFSQSKTNIIKGFVMERQSQFNMSQSPKQVNNIDSLLARVKKRNVSYSVSKYMIVLSESRVEDILMASSQAVIRKTSKPFVYFSVEQENGNVVVTTVCGNDSF